jgi:hypothetical protein
MTHTAKLAREEALTDALRVIDQAIGDEPPSDQALRILAAIKRLRDGQAARVSSLNRRDYMGEVQMAARAAWLEKAQAMFTSFVGDPHIGPHVAGIVGIDTPLGRLKLVTWQRKWTGRRGERYAWAGEYYINDEPITVGEIKAAGLAQRPTTRNRDKGS